MNNKKNMVPVPKLKKLNSLIIPFEHKENKSAGQQSGFSPLGFTLVELIVVITILAILATIGFVSFSGYLAGTRDTNRIAQLKSMSDALELYRTKKDLPLPDDKIDIKTSSKTIAYQGYIGKNVLETIEYTESGLDPKDKNYFSYYLTKDKKYFQLLSFLEEPSEDVVALNKKVPVPSLKKGILGTGTDEVLATDYSERYTKTTGKKLGILTDENNTPIQEIPAITGSGYLDLNNVGTTVYKSIIGNDEIITGSGTTLAGTNPKESCKRIKQLKGSSDDGIYIIDPNGDGIGFKVYCDMTTNGGGWTRTHLLKYDALPAENTQDGYKGMFTANTDYGDKGYRTNILNINYTEFAYLTDHDKSNVEFLSNGNIKTVGYKDEGFSEWIQAYTSGSNLQRSGNWYYYENLDFKNKETIDICSDRSTGYRNMLGERLLCGNNGAGTGRGGTNFPFGRQTFTSSSSKWCYGGKNACNLDYNTTDWASLWLR